MSDPARWISVGELAEAFGPDNYTPPPTADLAGSTHGLHFEDGQVVEYRFLSDRGWPGARPADERSGEAGYFALKPRDGIYFVDFVAGDVPPTAVSLVLDLRRRHRHLAGGPPARVGRRRRVAGGPHRPGRRVDGGHRRVLERRAGRAVHRLHPAPRTHHRPRRTPGGVHLQPHRAVRAHLSERATSTPGTACSGSEKGLADTDRCHYFKLGDDLYLFVWREKIVPTLGAVVVDFQAMRTMGKIFGHARASTVRRLSRRWSISRSARVRGCVT